MGFMTWPSTWPSGSKLDDADGPNVGVGFQLCQTFGWWHAVDVQCGQRLATFAIPSQTHVGDVDTVITEDGAQVANDTGPIFVGHHKQETVRDDFHRLAVESNDARVLGEAEK